MIAHFACLLARLPRYIQRHISWYAPADVPCRQTKIRRNLVESFLAATLKPQILVNQDNFHPFFGEWLFCNCPGVAYPIRAFTIGTKGCFGTGCFFIKSHGVDRRRIIFNPKHGFIQIQNNLITTDKNNDIFGPKSECANPVTDHIQIDKLSGFGYRVAACNKKVDQQRLPAPLQTFFRRQGFVIRIQYVKMMVVFKVIIKSGGNKC